MKIEDQIKQAVESKVAGRPPHTGAFERVTLRYRRQQRVRAATAIAGAAAAIIAAAIVVPNLGTSKKPQGFTTNPPTISTGEPTSEPSSTPTSTTPVTAMSCVPNCRLVVARSFASPVANATGITFDGKSLWIMAGKDGASNSLTEIDPVSGAVGRRYLLGNLAETAGSNVFGIASDGSTIYVSVSGNTNKIVRVDPDDGSIIGSYTSPTTLGPSDLEFDGEHLWLSSGSGELYRIDPATGEVLQELAAWPSTHRDNGIAVRAGQLWVGGLFEDGVAIQDIQSGELLDRVSDEQGTTIKKEWGPMTFAGGQLVLLDRFGVTFYDVT